MSLDGDGRCSHASFFDLIPCDLSTRKQYADPTPKVHRKGIHTTLLLIGLRGRFDRERHQKERVLLLLLLRNGSISECVRDERKKTWMVRKEVVRGGREEGGQIYWTTKAGTLPLPHLFCSLTNYHLPTKELRFSFFWKEFLYNNGTILYCVYNLNLHWWARRLVLSLSLSQTPNPVSWPVISFIMHAENTWQSPCVYVGMESRTWSNIEIAFSTVMPGWGRYDAMRGKESCPAFACKVSVLLLRDNRKYIPEVNLQFTSWCCCDIVDPCNCTSTIWSLMLTGIRSKSLNLLGNTEVGDVSQKIAEAEIIRSTVCNTLGNCEPS